MQRGTRANIQMAYTTKTPKPDGCQTAEEDFHPYRAIRYPNKQTKRGENEQKSRSACGPAHAGRQTGGRVVTARRRRVAEQVRPGTGREAYSSSWQWHGGTTRGATRNAVAAAVSPSH
jgi:hypothetical protein